MCVQQHRGLVAQHQQQQQEKEECLVLKWNWRLANENFDLSTSLTQERIYTRAHNKCIEIYFL